MNVLGSFKSFFSIILIIFLLNDSLESKDHNKPKNKSIHKKLGLSENKGNLRIIGSSIDYDIVYDQDNVLSARVPSASNRSVADTMEYVPADGGWNSYFYGYQEIGDAFMMCFQMDSDGIIKGLNVPIYHWGTGDQQITFSLHKLSYPSTSDGGTYPLDIVDANGWIGGYDMNSGNGYMSISGTTYSSGGTASVCNESGSVTAGAMDPLGVTDGTGPAGIPTKGLIWPDGSTALTGNPESHPAQQDNWYATSDYGTEPEVVAGDWVGLLVQATGAGGGDDPTLGFYYEEGEGIVEPWVALKFYGECGGTSGNGGWHIRHWMFNMQLAVELTGDRAPIFGSMLDLNTTTNTGNRYFSVSVTDDNPAGGTAGVESVTLTYQLDSLTATINEIDMELTAGTSTDGLWDVQIPGQQEGTVVYWSLSAVDINGNSRNTATASYFIWQPSGGRDLIFWNDNEFIYANSDYTSTIPFYWDNSDHFDIWYASYGNLTDGVVQDFDVIIELAIDDVQHNADGVIANWFNASKTYIVAGGDEWLGDRYGWGDDPITIPEEDVAYDILGIETYYPDINVYNNTTSTASGEGTSRLFTVANDDMIEPLHDFLDSVNLPLHYNPNYDPGHDNWIDGIDALPGNNVAITAYDGILNDDGSPSSTNSYNTMIYSNNNGKTAFLAFDVLGLYTGSNPSDNQHWIGAHTYNNYNVSPLGLVYEWLEEAPFTYQAFITISSENIVHGDTGLVDVSISSLGVELSSIDMSFAGFQGKLDFLEIVADSSSLMGSQGWLIQSNNTDSLLITASAGANNISEGGKLFSLKFAVPDTLSSQFIQINLVDFLGNTDMDDVGANSNGGVQSVWGHSIGFTQTETDGNYPFTVTFTDTSSGGTFPINSWSWNFGDDSTAFGPYVSHTYQLPGLYDVSLIITDQFGLTDTLVKSNLVEIDTVYGDVDWNATVQSFDASMILKELVDMVEFDNMQILVADVSSDNTLSTLDATLILQYMVGAIDVLPYDAGSQYVATGNVSMDDRGTGPGIPINIPLNISNGSNVFGFEMTVEFDHTLLEFDTLVLSELMDNFLLVYNNETDGELIIAASGGTPDGETGSFGTLTFNVSDNFSDETVVSITKMRWNEGPEISNPSSMTVSYALSVDDEVLPKEFSLYQNYPNPFNPTTSLRYDLPENNLVNITIYDMMGRQVKTLVNQTQDAGYKSVIWNATNDYGKPVSGGIYLYQIQAGEYISTKKMVLLK